MHLIHISESATYQVPSTWEELSGKQLRKMAWIITMKKAATDKAKLIFVVLTLSLPWWQRMRLWWFYFVAADTDERADLLICTQSFDQTRKLTEQKIQKIGGTFVRLYGPDSALANCTFWEYVKAEQYFINYLEKKDPIWLDKLVATLYRPEKKKFDPSIDTDRRIPLNDMAVRFRLDQVGRIDQPTKLAILMWFDGCRNFLTQAFPLVFQKSEKSAGSLDPISLMNKSKASGRSGWMQLISELAGGMQYYEAIGKTNLYTALTDISHRIQKANEARSHARKRK